MREYYLVQSKDDTGKLYISINNPKDRIDENGKQDELLFSWDENKTPLYNLVYYLIQDQIYTQDGIENQLELGGITEKDYTTVVRKVINVVSFDNMLKRIYVNSLHDVRMISNKSKNKLLIALSRLMQNQVRFIRSFDYSKIDYEKVKQNTSRIRTVYLSKNN